MNLNNTPLINGDAFDWASITFFFLGVNFKGVTEINYTKKREKKNNYAAGHEPSQRGRGRTEYEADITLEETEVRRILNALPKGQSLVDVPPFQIVVSYMVGTTTYTDIIKNVEFVSEGVAVKEGDTTIARKLPLIVAGIDFGRAA